MKVTLFLTLPNWQAHEHHHRHRRRSRETTTRRPEPRVRGSYNSGGIRAFRKLSGFLDASARRQVCDGLSEVTDELYDEATTALRRRDLRTLDDVVEQLKFASGGRTVCRLR